MAFIPLRPIHLTHLWPRGSISLNKTSAFKYRVSVNSKSAVSQYKLETGGDKTIVTHNFPLKCVPTIISCQPVFKTLVPSTSVNTLCLRSIFTNRHISRESQNSQSSISKTKVSASVLEGQTLVMGMWSLGLGAVGAAIASIILANTDYLLTKPAPATLDYLENADLKPIDDDDKTLKAKNLWEKSGAVIMAVRRPG